MPPSKQQRAAKRADERPTQRKRPRGRPSGARNRSVTKSGQSALIRGFYAQVGEEAWKQVLAAYPEASPAGKLFALLNAHGFANHGIERLCGEAGMDFGDLVRAFTQHSFGEAIIESSKRAREVVAGMTEDAMPSYATCRTCVGFKRVKVAHPISGNPVEIDCFDCGGTGQQRRPGDPRKLEAYLGAIGGVDEKESGPLVQLNQQFNVSAAHAGGVQRGQQLLAEGRRMRESRAATQVINVPANVPAEGS